LQHLGCCAGVDKRGDCLYLSRDWSNRMCLLSVSWWRSDGWGGEEGERERERERGAHGRFRLCLKSQGKIRPVCRRDGFNYTVWGNESRMKKSPICPTSVCRDHTIISANRSRFAHEKTQLQDRTPFRDSHVSYGIFVPGSSLPIFSSLTCWKSMRRSPIWQRSTGPNFRTKQLLTYMAR
jgi:hypothetical protein